MRVLVCGGRDYSDEGRVYEVLDVFHEDYEVTAVITGGARGADEFARTWAKAAQVASLVFRPDWTESGKAAGPIRNQRMLDEGKPDIVIAFPGGRGTADMVKRARKAGVEVKEVKA